MVIYTSTETIILLVNIKIQTYIFKDMLTINVPINNLFFNFFKLVNDISFFNTLQYYTIFYDKLVHNEFIKIVIEIII